MSGGRLPRRLSRLEVGCMNSTVIVAGAAALNAGQQALELCEVRHHQGRDPHVQVLACVALADVLVRGRLLRHAALLVLVDVHREVLREPLPLFPHAPAGEHGEGCADEVRRVEVVHHRPPLALGLHQGLPRDLVVLVVHDGHEQIQHHDGAEADVDEEKAPHRNLEHNVGLLYGRHEVVNSVFAQHPNGKSRLQELPNVLDDLAVLLRRGVVAERRVGARGRAQAPPSVLEVD
mmetsp:Transcript_67339/g.189762  ORF Transcript_67339/g.189762 Transcript_67339/m.189762 type:complete len:234 (-) Transcript_67339:1263-1964(-)